MLRIAIVDDEQEEREKLRRYVEKYFASGKAEISVLMYEDGEKLVREAPENLDILFLDIQMGQMDGVCAARQIRQYDENVLIIFITNMVQYAIEGYSVSALDFVIKPVDEAAVARELDKAMKRLKSRKAPVISIRGTDGISLVNAGDIRYIETYDRKLLVHTGREVIACSDTLQAMSEKLPDWFFRCHSAYLVNLRQVERIAGSDIVVCGEKIPLSKHRKKEFMQAMTGFIKEML